jgi:hypothetical protein
MAQKSAVPQDWVDRLAAMKRFSSAVELAEVYPPAHKVQRGTMEIWHYPLGVAGGMLYSIHVALSGEGAPQAYMHMEPSIHAHGTERGTGYLSQTPSVVAFLVAATRLFDLTKPPTI